MQFMVDCVVLLQHRLQDRVSLRTVRISKYRGTGFSESEFPLVIADNGIHVSTFAAPSLGLYPLEEPSERFDHAVVPFAQ